MTTDTALWGKTNNLDGHIWTCL